MSPIYLQLADELALLGHGDKTAHKRRYAEMLNVTVQTIDRNLMKLRGRMRPLRCDAGTCRDREAVETVLTLKKRVGETLPGRELPTVTAISLAKAEGLLPEDSKLTRETVDRVARSMAVSPKDRSVRVENAYANEVFQFDGSGSEYMFPMGRREDDGEWVLGFRTEMGKTKKINPRMNEMGIVKGQPGRNLVYYYATIDAYSRVVSLHVTVAEAENAFDSVTALDAAFRGEEGLLRGIPETIYTDQGPLSKHFGLGMCMELGIDLITHEKRNSRAKGKVESVWRDMWTHFELPFLVDMDRVITLSELRAYLKNYETELNSRVCPNLNLKGSGLTRAEAYAQSLTPARFRPCPVEPLQEYARRTWQSTVDGSGNITKDKITYRISECPATLLNRPATCHKTMNGDVRVRNPITFEWMNTVPHVPVTFGNFRGYKDDENDRLTERSKELKLRGLLHATAPAAPAVKLPENVTDLAGVRAAKGARVFQNATDAALWIADVLGIALAELPLVILDNVNAVCEEHHGNGAEIERLAAALKGAMDNK